jgi:predicted nucleotidyltransferase
MKKGKEEIFPKIEEWAKSEEVDIKCIYLGGSRVFGTFTEDSDWDCRIVVDDKHQDYKKEKVQEIGNFCLKSFFQVF